MFEISFAFKYFVAIKFLPFNMSLFLEVIKKSQN